MPFEVGVNSASEFNKYLTNVVVVTASVAWLLLLFLRSIDERVYRYWKPFSVAMTLQLFFVTLRNLTTMMLSSGFPIPCRWVAVIGGVIYQLFAISAECAMLIRCRSFTRYPRTVTYLTIPTWVVRFGLCIWLVTTITGEDNAAGYVCNTSMNYDLSAIMQYIKIATELIILVFFLERVIALHRSARGTTTDSNHSHWRRLALINAGITFLVILFEILVGQVTVYLTDYLFLTYSIVNLIQATLIVFIVEDTKNVFRKRAASSNNPSKQSSSNNATHSGSQRGNMGDQDVTIISYSDGVAAAKAGHYNSDPYGSTKRLTSITATTSPPASPSSQPWSLTMRVPTSISESVPVRYSPHASDRPNSSFYDFGDINQNYNYNNNRRHWDPDTESQNTVDEINRWKFGKAEDEIPMTLAKRREDAQSPV